MGSTFSKKKKKNKYGYRDKTRIALQNALKLYAVEYMTDIIMEYLSIHNAQKGDIVEMISPAIADDYVAYCTMEVVEKCEHNELPCCKSSTNNDYLKEVRISVHGSGGVGKSALTIQFVVNEFLEEYDPTIEDYYRKAIEIGTENYLLDILDTAGQEEFAGMQCQWIRDREFFILCFAINSRASWDEICVLREKLMRSCYDKHEHRFVLVATKCDLRQYDSNCMNRNEIIEQAKEWKMPFIETSAKDRKNIDFLFRQVVYEYFYHLNLNL
eukprot:309338_1